MEELKKTVINWIIGGLLTAMVSVAGVWDWLFAPASAPVAYSVQVPVSAFDYWWSRIMWSMLPLFAVVLLFVGCAFAWRIATANKIQKLKPDKQESEQTKFMQRVASGNPQGQLMPAQKPIEWLTLREAVNRSKGEEWILGQGIDQQIDKNKAHLVGQLFKISWNTHFAILGATRSGKTRSAAFMLVLLARVNRWHVIVLDGKGGQDWRKYDGVVEWHDLTPDNLAHYVNELDVMSTRRRKLLQSVSAGEINDLPPAKRPVRTLVIFEEFGFTWDGSDKNKEVVAKMNNLFRLSCSAGIHLCLVDQAPQLWSSQMTTNAAVSLCFRAKGQTLNAFGGYYCGNLKKGEFCEDTGIYKSWHVAGETINGMPVLNALPLQNQRLLMEPKGVESSNSLANDGFEDGLSANQFSNAANGSLQVVQTASNASNPQTFEENTTPVCPPSMRKAFERSQRWDEASRIFFQWNKAATQADLRQAMSGIDGRPPEAYKAEAFKWYHTYAPTGDPNKLIGKFGLTEDSVKGMKPS